jgi:hypothetical protein
MLNAVLPIEADAIKMQNIPDELTRGFCLRPCICLQKRRYVLMMKGI